MAGKEIMMLLDNAFAPDMRVRKEAVSLIEKGHRVTIISWDRQCRYKDIDEDAGIKIRRIRTNAGFRKGIKQLFFLFIFYLKVIPQLLRAKIDIIYCHDLLMLPLGILVKIVRQKKLIYDCHEIYWMNEIKKYHKAILAVIRFLEKHMIQHIDRFITVSEQRADYYKRFYKKEIFVVGNYYNPIVVSREKKRSLRRKLHLPEDKTLIAYVGALHIERDFHPLIEYARRHHNAYVVITGLGYWQDMIEKASRQLENLSYKGWVSNPIEYYSSSDIIYYVLNEEYAANHYNAPNNLYLSIALGIPIIANPIGDTGRIIKSYGIGAALTTRTAEGLEKAVADVLSNRDSIVTAFGKAQKAYNWDVAKDILQKAVLG